MKATSLIETIFSMLILAICITIASLLFFALTSYEDRIENIVSKQETRNEFIISNSKKQNQENVNDYKVTWEIKE